MSSSEFDGGEAVEPAAVVPAVPVRRYAGKLVVFFVLACTIGAWVDLENVLDAQEPVMPPEGDLVLGICTGWWEFVRHEDMPSDELTKLMVTAICGRRYQLAQPVSYGYLVYRVAESIQLVEPCGVPSNLGPAGIRDALNAYLYRQIVGVQHPGPQTVSAWFHRLSGNTRSRMSLVKFAPWVAAYVLGVNARLLHCVIVTMPFRRRHCIGKFAPTLEVVRSWVQQADSLPIVGLESDRWKRLMHDPIDVIEWVEATAFIRNVDEGQQCAESFARLFGKYCPGVTVSQLMAHLKPISADVLRRARVQVDCVAMLFFQEFFKLIDLEDCTIFLYVDGSPQHRGVEMFAASIDIILGNWPDVWWRRILLPVVALSRW